LFWGFLPSNNEEILTMRDVTKRSSKLSRRSVLLRGAACAAGAAVALAANVDSAKAAKLPQKSAGYQPTPKGDRECSNCKLFVPPDECQKVAGKISPHGYCLLYQKA
jgi:hypothetical protein